MTNPIKMIHPYCEKMFKLAYNNYLLEIADYILLVEYENLSEELKFELEKHIFLEERIFNIGLVTPEERTQRAIIKKRAKSRGIEFQENIEGIEAKVTPEPKKIKKEVKKEVKRKLKKKTEQEIEEEKQTVIRVQKDLASAGIIKSQARIRMDLRFEEWSNRVSSG